VLRVRSVEIKFHCSCFDVGQKFQRELLMIGFMAWCEISQRRWVRRGWEVGQGRELEKWGFGLIGDPFERNFDGSESSKFKIEV
jgi:hypothetical protein